MRSGSFFLSFVVLKLLFLFFLIYSALLDALFGILGHVVGDDYGSVYLQLVLHLSEVLKAQLHPVQAYGLPMHFSDSIASHAPLQNDGSLVFVSFEHLGPHAQAQVHSPRPLDFCHRYFTDVADQAEPCSKLSFFPPALYPDSSLHLPHSEHLPTHEQLHPIAVEVVQHVVSLRFRQSHPHFVFVFAVNLEFLLHVLDLLLELDSFLSLANLPLLVLLSLDGLQSQRVVRKWVFNVRKVRLVRNQLLPTSSSIKLCSQ